MADTSAEMLRDSIAKNDEYHINKILFEKLFEPNLTYDHNAIIIEAYNMNNIKIMTFLFKDKGVISLLKSENKEYYKKIHEKILKNKINNFN
jgi:hypothetical protein